MDSVCTKWQRALSIVAVAFQIPLLWLWRITYDAVRLSAHRLEMMDDGRIELVFRWELLGIALLDYLPVVLPLVACLVLPVVGAVSAFRRKPTYTPGGMRTVCCYAVAFAAAAVLLNVFSLDYMWWEQGRMNSLYLCEYTLLRNLGRAFLPAIPVFMALKFAFLALYGTTCAALCGLELRGMTQRRRTMPKYGEDR